MTAKTKLQMRQAKQYLTVEPSNEPEQKLGFTINPLLIAIVTAVFAFLYLMFEQHRVKLFVYSSLLVDLAHPFLLSFLNRQPPLKLRLLQGTLLTSLMLHVWTLYYPQKVFVYYLPQAIGLIAKLTDLLVSAPWRNDVTTQLCKFQSKVDILVLTFCLVSCINSMTRLKLIWPRIGKWLLLLAIFRFKYWQQYGCQLACSEIHFTMDHLSKTLLLRPQYQQLHAKLSLLGNPFNTHKEILL